MTIGYSNKDHENFEHSLEHAAELLNNHKNIIKNISAPITYNDQPKIYNYDAFYKIDEDHTLPASGFSFNKKIALMRMLGETIERYCLYTFKPEAFFSGSVKKIQSNYLDPRVIVNFSSNQLSKRTFKRFRIDEDSPFDWIKGVSLLKNTEILIPAQLITFNYQFLEDEPCILMPLSTGTATGYSYESAVIRAICEVVEREAFLISYLNKLHSPHINIEFIKDKNIQKILSLFKRYNLELMVLNLTNDLKIPVFMALTIDRTGIGPAVSLGLKAGFNIINCILGAIEESLLTQMWTRDLFFYKPSKPNLKKTIITIKERAHYWFEVEMLKNLDFWLENYETISIHNLLPYNKDYNLSNVLDIFEKNNLDVYYSNIAHEFIRKYGFTVARVIVPQLQPFYLDERYPYFGGDRLYTSPVRTGYLKKPNKEEELNPIPHPFL